MPRVSLSDNQVVIDKYPNPSNTILDKDNNNTYYAGSHVGDIWGFQTIGIEMCIRDRAISYLPTLCTIKASDNAIAYSLTT